MFKILGIVLFCSLLPMSQGVVPGIFSVVSPGGFQNVLSGALLQDGLLQKHLQAIPIPDIVSGGGLLGSLTSITGLNVVSVQLPTVSVTLLPGIGAQLAIATKLDINGVFLVGLIDISVDVNLNVKLRFTNYSAGVFQVAIEDCQSLLSSFNIRLLSGLLPVSVTELVSSTLTTTLPNLLCPVVSDVLKLVNVQLLGTLNELVPLGAVGAIQYQLASLPLISDLHVGLDLNTVIQQVGGGTVSLPVSSIPTTLPPLQGNVLNLGLTQAFLNALVSLLLQIQPLTIIATPDVFSGAAQLTDAIVALIPAGCTSCSVAPPLNIKIAVAGAPLVTLEANKATIKLAVKIEVFTKQSDGAIQTLLALQADLLLNAQVSVAGGKLLLSLSLTSAALTLESSEVGIVSVSSLGTLINNLLVETFLPLINGALAVGLPLPEVLGIKLLDAAVQLVEGLAVVRV